jgi:hypothetical protein
VTGHEMHSELGVDKLWVCSECEFTYSEEY